MTEPIADLTKRLARADPPLPSEALRWDDPDPDRSYAAFMAAVDRARPQGISRSDNGTELIGRAPHVAPLAWMHSLYLPLPGDQLALLEARCRRAVPEGYRWWLRLHNGLGLFVSALSLYGWQPLAIRNPAVRLPFDLSTPNLPERPRDAPDEAFFIGGYSHNPGYLLWLHEQEGTVHLCTRTSAVSLCRWPSVPVMIASEARRLNELYDEFGRLIGVQDV